MAISPNDTQLTPEELAKIEALEAQIDSLLKSQYVKDQAWIRVSSGNLRFIPTRIRTELIRRYQEAGWEKVQIVDDGEWKFFSRI